MIVQKIIKRKKCKLKRKFKRKINDPAQAPVLIHQLIGNLEDKSQFLINERVQAHQIVK